MKIVLIPHPTEQIFLRNFQTEILSKINEKSVISLPNFPLWLDFYDFDSEIFENSEKILKNLRNSIKKVELEKIFLDSKEIFLETKIQLNSENFTKNLKIGSFKNLSENENFENIKKKLENVQKNFELPKSLKIFELGILEKSRFSWAVSSSIWVKLKK